LGDRGSQRILHAQKIQMPTFKFTNFNKWESFHQLQYFSYIVVVSFIGGGNWSTEKTIDLSQVADKLYYTMLYLVHPAMSRIQTRNFSGDRH
jgi:hypothetical protein